MTEPLVILEAAAPAPIVRLNRPCRHNALVPELLQALLQALAEARRSAAPALVLTATGASFSTGGDLLGFHQHRDNIAGYAGELVGLLNQTLLALYTHPVPVCCAVQGQVTGGALGFLLTADHVIMRAGVTVTPWYAEVGFSPDGGWTALLPEQIGRRRAADWLYRNRTEDAASCLTLGIAGEVVAGDPVDAAQTWAARIATMRGGSVAQTRHLLRSDENDVRLRLKSEREAFVQQIQTTEALAGIERYLRGEIT